MKRIDEKRAKRESEKYSEENANKFKVRRNEQPTTLPFIRLIIF